MEYMKLSLRAMEFQRRVNDLRQRLETAKEVNSLPVDLLEEIEEAKSEEALLLRELLPYHRSASLNDKEGREFSIVTLVNNRDELEKANDLSELELEGCKELYEEFDDGALETLESIESIKTIESIENSVDGVTSCCCDVGSRYVCGMEDGRILIVELIDGNVTVKEMFQAMPGMVVEVLKLREENQSPNDDEGCDSCESNQQFLAVGQDGYIAVFSQKDLLINRFRPSEDDFFFGCSNGGTAIIVNEQGDLYYLEENLGRWQLREKPLITNYFVTRAVPFDKDRYLCLNENDGADILGITVPKTNEDLWNMELFT